MGGIVCENPVCEKALSLSIATFLICQVLLVNLTFAAAQDEAWIATPYQREDSTLIEGLEASVAGKKHWLETTDPLPVTVTVADGVLTMQNGIIQRDFKIPSVGGTEFYTKNYENLYIEKSLLKDEIKPDAYIALYDVPYRDVYKDAGIKLQHDSISSADCTKTIPEDCIMLDPEYFFVGGQGNANTFVFDGYEIKQECEKPFDWEPHPIYGDPAAADWPPKGMHVEFNFSAPDTFPEAYRGVKIKIIYEMYDNISAMKKRVEITNMADNQIMVGRLAPEILNGNENLDELLTLENSYTCGDQSTLPVNRALPCRCNLEKASSPFKELESMAHTCYEVGPAYELKTGESLISFDTYEIIHSTYWFELQMRERLGIYRKLFPWTSDNPLTHHNTGSLTTAVIDQAAEAGFEMIIQSYSAPDSSSQMLSRSQAILDNYKNLVDYAHSKGVAIGIYQAQYQRSAYKGGESYGTNANGHWSTWCMASAAFDDYWDNFKNFVEYTGLDCVEIDGAWPGEYCVSGEKHVNTDKETDPADPSDTTTGDPSKYKVHNGFFDSVTMQWENAVRMLCKDFRDMGVYIKIPGWYYVNGSNKCGIGYEEAAWSQPRHEQLIYGRQIMYNASYARTMSMSWSHVPFAQYQGGGGEAAFQPFKDKKEDYNWILAQNLGNGVASDFRGPNLYDDETLGIMQKWVGFYQRYRGIVNSDMVHISQAAYDAAGTNRQRGVKMDTLYHVNSLNEGEKGLLWVYNQTDEERTEIITVPMYYTGLTNLNYPTVPLKDSLGKNVRRYGSYPPNYSWIPASEPNYRLPEPSGTTGNAAFMREGVEMEILSIDSNGNAQLQVTLSPMSFTFYTIYDEADVPEVDIEVSAVQNVTIKELSTSRVHIAWDANTAFIFRENGEPVTNPFHAVTGFNVYRDGIFIGQTFSNTFTDINISEYETYQYTVTALVVTAEGSPSDALTVTVPGDVANPEIVSVISPQSDTIVLTFSEPMDADSAENAANYTITGGKTVIRAQRSTDGMTVALTVDSLMPLTPYTLRISGLKDAARAKNPLPDTDWIVVYGYLAYYAMDGVSGGLIQGEMGATDAVVSGITYTSGTGKNGCIYFNAKDADYVDLGSGLFENLDTYSISLFVWPANPAASSVQSILSAGQENVTTNDLSLYLEDGALKFRTCNTDESAVVALASTNPVKADAWNQVVLTRDGDTFKLYLNGSLQATQTQSDFGTFDSLSTVYLGTMKNHAGGDRTAYFAGRMDEFFLGRESMDAQRISADYTAYQPYAKIKPIIFLDFEAVDGDRVVNKADNTTYGITGTVQQTTSGNGSSALKFTGSNYINMGNEYQLGGEFTVSALINVATTGDNQNHKIFGRGYTTVSQGEFYACIRNGGYNIAFTNMTTSGGGNLYDYNKSYLSTNTWAHFAVTCDGSTVKLYLNGQLHSVTGAASNVDLSGNLRNLLVGGGWNSTGTGIFASHMFKGEMDEVLLYDIALNAEQIAVLDTIHNPPSDPMKITSVSVTTPTIVETLAANLRINVTGENLEDQTLTAYLRVNGMIDESTATNVTSGTGLMKIAKAPTAEAVFEVVVKVDGTDTEGSFTMTLAAYNPEMLWSPSLDMDDDGKLLVWFAEPIGANSKTGYTATINGKSHACEEMDDNVLRIDADIMDLETDAQIVVGGIKYPNLFPSYSFTFTIKAP